MWRRSRLPVPVHPGLRPTPDRVRETLYNWLGQDLTGWRVLDAYAGSGALGFEAGSRGAAEVTLIERDAQLVRSLIATRQRLKADSLQIESADALAWMRRAATDRAGLWDLVLLDPPFDAGLFETSLQAAMPLLRPGGCLYLEAPAQWQAEVAGATLHRHLQAGAVHAHLWIKSGAPAS